MNRVLCLGCFVLILLGACTGSSRRKRVVGGEPANPPPPGASEAEDVVENPVLVSARPVTSTTTTTTTTTQRPVDNSPDDGAIVFVDSGRRRREAKVKGRKEPGDPGLYSFEGMRYADPPVGSLRFQRPKTSRLKGEVEATTPGPPCPQTVGQRLIGSEDCLFLNVYAPEIPTESSSKKYPVLFWIHGGGFRRGSGSQYGVSDLVKKGLVVVTIQYRLGSLGFLSTNRKELPGNAGLFDIAASLRWVRRYIRFFGGDPNHIIPAGQGSGASAAVMLTLAHFSKNWIKGVFAMSGSAISSFAVDTEPAGTAKEVSAIDNCQSGYEGLAFVRCMQKLPLETVIRGDDKLQETRLAKDDSAQSYITSISKLLNPGPAVEGEDDLRFLPNFLTGTPAQILQEGNFAKVPLLTGVTKDETSTSAKGGGLATRLLGQVEATEELLEKMIPQLLNINSGIFGNNSLSPVLSQLFSNNAFLKGIKSSLSGAASNVDKLIELTTDALFNLPAFLTSQYWSKQNKAYLYSFEHESRSSSADDFLKENPLTEQPSDAAVEGVGHGDDLAYLFDVRSIEGQTVQIALSEENDLQVRDKFTSMVAEFARSGQPKVDGQSAVPFTTEGGDYMIINSSPSLAKGFRKCQMGLWAGLTEVLKSAECSFLQLGDVLNNVAIGGLTNATKSVTGTLTKPLGGLAAVAPTPLTGAVPSPTPPLTGTLGGLGGLVGGNKRQTQKPSLLGGLG